MATWDSNFCERVAIWRANDGRCLYCREAVAFRDLDIDHIIPSSVQDDEFADIAERLHLDSDYTLESLRNRVPAHHNCNMRKSDQRYHDGTLRYFIELWHQKRSRLENELARIHHIGSKSDVLADLGAQLASGVLLLDELSEVIQDAVGGGTVSTGEPWIVTFEVGVADLLLQEVCPVDFRSSRLSYRCNWLEDQLVQALRRLPAVCKPLGKASRSKGEMSLRVVVWNLARARFDSLAHEVHWNIADVAPYSEMETGPWDELFQEALRERGKDGGYAPERCPDCGCDRLKSSCGPDDADEFHLSVWCSECDCSIYND